LPRLSADSLDICLPLVARWGGGSVRRGRQIAPCTWLCEWLAGNHRRIAIGLLPPTLNGEAHHAAIMARLRLASYFSYFLWYPS